jgi:hypothetical protein
MFADKIAAAAKSPAAEPTEFGIRMSFVPARNFYTMAK